MGVDVTYQPGENMKRFFASKGYSLFRDFTATPKARTTSGLFPILDSWA